MRNYEIALFDLDGTLSESGEGILYCVRKVFKETGRALPDEKTIQSFIGPPMYDSLSRCGFEDAAAKEGVEIYKRNYLEYGIYKNKVYEGMHETLTRLRDAGVRLGVASTKYQAFTDRIINMLDLRQYFSIVGGSNVVGVTPAGETPRRDKIDVMNYVIDSLRQNENDRIVMIGDTKYDADGAAKTGTDFIGCLFGYGSREEMIQYYTSGSPYFVESPAGITDIIL